MATFDPTSRLDRIAVGDTMGKAVELVVRLDARTAAPDDTRVLAGESLKMSNHVAKKAKNTREIHPYVPQIPRLIKQPMEMEASRPSKVDGRPAVPWADLGREHLKGSSQLAREARGTITEGNPMRAIHLGPQAREAKLPVDAWLRGRR